jgi:hypothetical protein
MDFILQMIIVLNVIHLVQLAMLQILVKVVMKYQEHWWEDNVFVMKIIS